MASSVKPRWATRGKILAVPPPEADNVGLAEFGGRPHDLIEHRLQLGR